MGYISMLSEKMDKKLLLLKILEESKSLRKRGINAISVDDKELKEYDYETNK